MPFFEIFSIILVNETEHHADNKIGAHFNLLGTLSHLCLSKVCHLMMLSHKNAKK